MEQNQAAEKQHKDLYATVTDQFIDLLQQGIVPWRMSWAKAGIPRNLSTGNAYRSINLMLLHVLGYKQNIFITYRQLQDAGGKVKQGEKGHMIVYLNFPKNEQGSKKQDPYLRDYKVFNIEQCENAPEHLLPADFKEVAPIVICENIIQSMPNQPRLQHKAGRAWYNPIDDVVNMPKPDKFDSIDSYYQMFFHQLVHSTGHMSRIDRKDLLHMAEFSTDTFSHEELTAEIGAGILAANAGIEIDNDPTAEYINGWVDKLKKDKRLIFSASAAAQKAVDYILNVKAEAKEDEDQKEALLEMH
jgi:antirestriction protein ArdC